jgi:Arc/MetJ-type ribon-helix-helix transcriptional regulator
MTDDSTHRRLSRKDKRREATNLSTTITTRFSKTQVKEIEDFVSQNQIHFRTQADFIRAAVTHVLQSIKDKKIALPSTPPNPFIEGNSAG